MPELSLQLKIDTLIRQLEEEVQKLSSSYQTEMSRMKETNALDLIRLKDQFDRQIAMANEQYQLRIQHLEGEISYLKELNFSQRLMMEDSTEYIKALEEKLNIAPSLVKPSPEA